MPRRRALTEAQLESLLALPDGEADLIRHWTLVSTDLPAIERRRGTHNQLGYALQLCAFRYPGRLLRPGEVIPEAALHFVAGQLRIGADALAAYAGRSQACEPHVGCITSAWRGLAATCGSQAIVKQANPIGCRLFRSLRTRKIRDDCGYVFGGNRRLVNVDHLVHLGLPCGFWHGGLVQDHARRVAGEAVVVDRFGLRLSREHALAGRKIDGDRLERDRRLSCLLRTPSKRHNRRTRNEKDGKTFRYWKHLHLPPQAALTCVVSITFRMNPDGFQFASAGCTTPLLFVQRTISVCSPGAAGVNCICHRRKLYLPSSAPSCDGCHVLPPSRETSTRETPVSPPNAMPRTRVDAPVCTVSPGLRFVMNDRGTMRLIGTLLKSVSPGLMLACGVSGMV